MTAMISQTLKRARLKPHQHPQGRFWAFPAVLSTSRNHLSLGGRAAIRQAVLTSLSSASCGNLGISSAEESEPLPVSIAVQERRGALGEAGGSTLLSSTCPTCPLLPWLCKGPVPSPWDSGRTSVLGTTVNPLPISPRSARKNTRSVDEPEHGRWVGLCP